MESVACCWPHLGQNIRRVRVLIVQHFVERHGSLVMMPCAPQSVQQKRQKLSAPRRRHDLFGKIVIALKSVKCVATRSLNLSQIFQHLCRRIQRFRQRPLKRIVPKIRSETTEALLDRRGAPQDLFSARIDRTVGLRVKQFAGKTRDQFMRSLVNIGELSIEVLD